MLDYIRWIIAIEASLNFFRQNVLSELHAQGSLAFEDETELILRKKRSKLWRLFPDYQFVVEDLFGRRKNPLPVLTSNRCRLEPADARTARPHFVIAHIRAQAAFGLLGRVFQPLFKVWTTSVRKHIAIRLTVRPIIGG